MSQEGIDAAECARLARQGDEQAARQLLTHLTPLVTKLVRAHLPRRSHEEDLVQTVFMKVFAKLDQFSGAVPLEHWVSRITVNTCFNELRREHARPELRWADLTESEEQVIGNLTASGDDLPVSDRLAARELVEKMLAQLSPKDRLLITVLHLEGRSVDEVCRLTGWNPPVVKVRAFRARQRMKKHVGLLMKEHGK
jgi:RNA polymerase sigma-70 factor (ECF subfamily)